MEAARTLCMLESRLDARRPSNQGTFMSGAARLVSAPWLELMGHRTFTSRGWSLTACSA